MDIVTKETFKTKLQKLVEHFSDNEDYYKSTQYKEDHVRQEFINPFFKALGWDMDNEQGFAPQYREVIHEDRLEIEGKPKAPDYAFKVGSDRKFFVEAKASSVKVFSEIDPAFQLRRYAWSGKLPVSILTDFEEFSIYDTTIEPKHTDKSSVARVKYIHYKDYIKEADYLWDTFSKEAVWKGSFDKFAKREKKGSQLVDKSFLKEIELWRDLVAKDIASNNKLNIYELNFVVQKFIDRIIFLRIAEDRGVETYETLRSAIKSPNTYSQLLKIFSRADEKYNSSLFDLKKDELSAKIKISDKTLDKILNNLYYPKSPYEFSVIGVDILGSVYEQFLGKVIRLTKGGNAVIEEKPEVKKAGGVYYTPQYIVDYIVKNTVGELVEGKTPKDVAKLKIVDPACGSGSFLIGAYNYLLNWHHKYYVENDVEKNLKAKKLFKDAEGNFFLSTQEKKDILLNNIHGVDIDPQAVEVTKLSLALKMLEGENSETIGAQFVMFADRILPDLSSNIKCGNSLIGSDYYSDKQITLLGDEELRKVNAFDWGNEFPLIFRYGGFDAVIGNPPYVNSREIEAEQKNYFAKYEVGIDQYDLYTLFTEKGLQILKNNGLLSFITPDKFIITNYGKKIKDYIYRNAEIINVVDYTKENVFNGVSVYPVVFILKKGISKETKTFEEFVYEIGSSILLKVESKESIDIDVWRPLATSKNIAVNSGGSKIVSNREVTKFGFRNLIEGTLNGGRLSDAEPNKIIMKKLCYEIEAGLDDLGLSTINTVYCIKADSVYLKYLLGVLNSRLITFYARNKYKGTSLRGGYIELRVFQIKELNIAIPSKGDLTKMDSLVSQIRTLSNDNPRWNILKEKIDALVYDIYSLSKEEVQTVEDYFANFK
ncbi:N-6 DNA methylase [Candidatus Dojkabacteria bacterium]|uniref:site-specific DNA-methyltransferase (adenine-specific) n=1 Tax=Candidatus Dojkabacteria bacterium TaxID=2099670 RepID=A0A847D1X3_9BACT|nr:N-6 DNA methylase [Candidatus Dojkabacteria bacterium]